MHAEHTSINCCRQRQKVKHFSELLPDNKASIFALALDLEAIDLCNLARLVIATQ